MTASCPKCATPSLLEVSGPPSASLLSAPQSTPHALQCEKCGGFWVPEAALTHPSVLEELTSHDPHPATRPEGDKRTGQCPAGHGILRRTRVAWENPYFLERCAICHGVWFDAGEWSRLASDKLLANLPDLWTAEWREHLTDERAHASLESDLCAKLGEEVFSLITALVERLEHHEQRAVALAYLRERLRHRNEPGDAFD